MVERSVAVGVLAVADPGEHVEAVRDGTVASALGALLAAEGEEDPRVVEQLDARRLVDVGIEFQRDRRVGVGDVDRHVPGPIGDRDLVDRVTRSVDARIDLVKNRREEQLPPVVVADGIAVDRLRVLLAVEAGELREARGGSRRSDQTGVPNAAVRVRRSLGLPSATAERAPRRIERSVDGVAVFIQRVVAGAQGRPASPLVGEGERAVAVDGARTSEVTAATFAAFRCDDSLGAGDVRVSGAEPVQPAVEVLVFTPLGVGAGGGTAGVLESVDEPAVVGIEVPGRLGIGYGIGRRHVRVGLSLEEVIVGEVARVVGDRLQDFVVVDVVSAADLQAAGRVVGGIEERELVGVQDLTLDDEAFDSLARGLGGDPDDHVDLLGARDRAGHLNREAGSERCARGEHAVDRG